MHGLRAVSHDAKMHVPPPGPLVVDSAAMVARKTTRSTSPTTRSRPTPSKPNDDHPTPSRKQARVAANGKSPNGKSPTRGQVIRKNKPDAPKKRGKLAVGDPAPELRLSSDDGKVHRLADYRGKRIVLYFYPRDNTPGCTRESCDFRDLHRAFSKANTVVLGISGDSLESHNKFRRKFELSFPLLSDPGHQVARVYGAYGPKTLYGKTVEGVIRSTFVIATDGRIEQIYSPVRVDGHAQKVLSSIAE